MLVVMAASCRAVCDQTLNRDTSERLQVWQPGTDAVGEGETLQYDPTAYDCLHQLTFEWPSLRCGRC